MPARYRIAAALSALLVTAIAAPAAAQRLTFERSFNASGATTLDVSTIRGKIDVTVGGTDTLLVIGTVTVRAAWDTPANAVDIARRVAAQPPVENSDGTVRLRPPSEADARRAVTVSYAVQVPAQTRVIANTDSGAVTIAGVNGAVAVTTQSSAIDLTRLGGSAVVKTGSGAVQVNGIAGALEVSTSSSAIEVRDLQAGLHVRTNSGAVQAFLIGQGDVDVRTSSSAIKLQGVGGALTASTQSGRIDVSGHPHSPWQVSTGSGAVDMAMAGAATFSLNAMTGSGSVRLDDMTVSGSIEKRQVSGTVLQGGPLVRVVSRSGSILVRGARAS